MAGHKAIGVVVLHYLVADMTAQCVDVLLERHAHERLRVVIVDNASPNGSGKVLADRYQDDERVQVIVNEENLGFARGNNVGYRMLREQEDVDFVAIINNDLLIEQEDFFELVRQIYATTPFAVLGPDIVSVATGQHQSPCHLTHPSRQKLLESKRAYETLLQTGAMPTKAPQTTSRRALHAVGKHLSPEFKRRLKQFKRRIEGKPAPPPPLWEAPHENVVLHGACYVFSQDFLTARESAFNPCTFLYLEEDILHYECMRDGLSMRYDPRLVVRHFEDVATEAALGETVTVSAANGVAIDAKEAQKRAELCRSIDAFLAIMDSDSAEAEAPLEIVDETQPDTE